jgi:hypothetical protein
MQALHDDATDVDYFLYEILPNGLVIENGTKYVGALIANIGAEKDVLILDSTSSVENGTFERIYRIIGRLHLEAEQVVSIAYPVPYNMSECNLHIVNADRSVFRFRGKIAYLNTLGERDVSVNVLLYDDSSGKLVDEYEVIEHFGSSESRIIEYNFDEADTYRSYRVQVEPVRGLTVQSDGTTNPRYEDVRFVRRYC